FAPCPK
nr:RecName: Full=Uncharacterized protein SMPP5 [Nautilus macromphalus]